MTPDFDPASAEVINEHFAAWWTYWGELIRCYDPIPGGDGETVIYGFENVSEANFDKITGVVPDTGAAYGYVGQGSAYVHSAGPHFDERASTYFTGEWFVTPGGCTMTLSPGTRVVITQRTGFRAMPMGGGPIEERGRLKYIDLCSDTLLAHPPVKGDPCLNHLFFPPGIDQTEHYHPSNRSGMVARGRGSCVTPYGSSELVPGLLFHIPHHGLHKFQTLHGESMDIIAYHPDSDWGPEHEVHPMINRTWVGEIAPLDSVGFKAPTSWAAEVVQGWSTDAGAS